MSPIAIVALALKLSTMLLVFALGLNTERGEALYLARRPGQLVRSLLAMNVLMPLVAAALVLLIDLPQAERVMLVCVALAPVPPMLPKKQVKAGGHGSYAIGLLCAAAAFAIVSIPVSVEALERGLGIPLSMTAFAVAKITLLTVFAPLGAGIVVRSLAPRLAERIAAPISRGALAVLVLAVLTIAIVSWRGMLAQISVGVVVAICGLILCGLLIGHLLGGPDPADRTVLALATASRHPGMALAIASANFPETPDFVAALLLYLIAAALLSPLYFQARRAAAARLAVASR